MACTGEGERFNFVPQYKALSDERVLLESKPDELKAFDDKKRSELADILAVCTVLNLEARTDEVRSMNDYALSGRPSVPTKKPASGTPFVSSVITRKSKLHLSFF